MKRESRFEIYKDMHGEYRWVLVSSNGNIVAESVEGYRSKYGCKRAIGATIKIITEGKFTTEEICK